MTSLLNISFEYVFGLWTATPVFSLIVSNLLLIGIIFVALTLIEDNFNRFPKRFLDEAILAAGSVLLVQFNKPICTAWGYLGVFATCCYCKKVVARLTPANASGSAAAPIKEWLGSRLSFERLTAILFAQTFATILALEFDATFTASGNTCAFNPQQPFLCMAVFEVLASCMLMALNDSPSRLKDEVVLTMHGLLGVARVYFIGIGGINISVYVRNLLLCPNANTKMTSFAVIPVITAIGSFFVERWSVPEDRNAVLPR
uniref:Aquaporin n=1 Tax=Panagrellus redivivus TaxID=6233 RepID=A0A7E4VYI7_PANRE